VPRPAQVLAHVLYAFIKMKNKNAGGAKYLGLFCVPLIPLVALLGVQRIHAHQSTKQLLSGFGRNSKSSRNRVEELVRRGADVNARDEEGCTPLHTASSMSLAEMQTLTNSGADVNAKSYFGATPLIFAASSGSRDAVRFLLKHGARVDEQMTDEGRKWTALSIAQNRMNEYQTGMPSLAKQFPPVIQLLKAAGAKE
jgi:ankyrin repeat protein